MKFAFPLPHMMRLKAATQSWETNVTGADQTRMVKRADELGYDVIHVPEHFVIPRSHVELSGPHAGGLGRVSALRFARETAQQDQGMARLRRVAT